MRDNAEIRVAIYTRVSTATQTTENQKMELRRVADARGWHIVCEFTDEGFSGSKGRDQRPALDSLLKGATRGEFDMVAIWSVDRLGRSLQHLVETVNELHAVGVNLYLHTQSLDTSTPSGKLMFSVFGSLAEYERAQIRERIRAGIERAKAQGTRMGRPTNVTPSVKTAVIQLRAANHSIRSIGRSLRIGTGSVYRILREASNDAGMNHTGSLAEQV
jgi:DNA invertase Pin-like site-specific DNA recombinase